MSVPTRRMACSSRFFGSVIPASATCLSIMGLRLGGRLDAPHPGEGVHVERQVVDFIAPARHGRVGVAVEVRELLHVVPDLAVRGVEDVRAVAVHLDALDRLGVDVSGDVGALVDDEHALALLTGFVREHRAEEPRLPTTR